MLRELEDLIQSKDSIFASHEHKVHLDYFDILFTTKDNYDEGKPLIIRVNASFEEIRTIPNLAQDIYNRAEQELKDMLD